LSHPVQVIPLSPCFGNASFFYAIDRKDGRREYFALRWIRVQIERTSGLPPALLCRTKCGVSSMRKLSQSREFTE